MNFDLLRGGGGGGGASGKIFATMLLHWRFPLIDMQHVCFFLKNVNFNLLTPRASGRRGSAGISFATMLLHP